MRDPFLLAAFAGLAIAACAPAAPIVTPPIGTPAPPEAGTAPPPVATARPTATLPTAAPPTPGPTAASTAAPTPTPVAVGPTPLPNTGPPGPPPATPAPRRTLPPAPDAPTWSALILGDSLTWAAFTTPEGQPPPGWIAVWTGAYHVTPPVVYNGGVIGETGVYALGRLDRELEQHPTARYVGIAFGTNDCLQGVAPEAYGDALRTYVTKIRAKGMTPLLATLTFGANPRLAGAGAYYRAAEAVRGGLDVASGPDLWSFGQQHPELYDPDEIHFQAAGQAAIAGLWADAVATRATADGLR